jgi:hypothetical protein
MAGVNNWGLTPAILNDGPSDRAQAGIAGRYCLKSEQGPFDEQDRHRRHGNNNNQSGANAGVDVSYHKNTPTSDKSKMASLPILEPFNKAGIVGGCARYIKISQRDNESDNQVTFVNV